MKDAIQLIRTNTDIPDFQRLIKMLDNELWNELKEDQATYDPLNKVPGIPTAVIVYVNDIPAAIGCIKIWNDSTAEIKRMFVQKEHRGKGLSKMVLQELEKWAVELNSSKLVLETSIRFKVAQQLYIKSGFVIMPNYPPYIVLPESICMRKEI